MDEPVKHIDLLFKKAIEEHSELPSNNVWEQVEQHLQRKNVVSITKKYKRWKWAAAALLIFSAGLAMYTLHLSIRFKKVVKEHKAAITNAIPNNESVKRNDTTTSLVNVNPSSTLEKKTPQSLASEENNNTARAITKQPGEPVILKNKASNDDKQAAGITGVTDASNKAANNIGKISNDGSVVLTKAPGNSNVTPVKRNKLTGKKSDAPVAIDKDNNKVEPPAKGKEKLIQEKDDKSGVDNKTDIPGKDELRETFNSFRAVTVKEATNLTIGSANDVAAFLSIQLGRVAGMPVTPVPVPNNNTNRNVYATIHRGKYITSVFYGNEHVETVFQPNHPDFKEDQYEKIRNRETNRAATVFGASVVRNISKHFGVETGLKASTLSFDISAKPLVARRDNNGKINYRLSTSAGYVYYALKNRPNPSMADSVPTLSSTGTLKYISVPFGIQFQSYYHRLSFTPAALVTVNFLTSANITTIQSLERTYSGKIEGSNTRYFDGVLRLGLGYYVTKRIGLNVIGYNRFALSQATGGKPVTAKRNATGAAAGLNYNF